ncbi:hypothetical protein E4U30_005503 [Claviceps sp. LM220 group G6]|nr:hypothetical protein E4U30_005503 [Claviceps sp. LM220 group G6]
MAGYGFPRSLRDMDRTALVYTAHMYRIATDDGTSKLVKWHWKSKQGKDLFDTILSGNYSRVGAQSLSATTGKG